MRISVDADAPALYADLHGTPPERFHRLFESARDLLDAGVTVGISMVVMVENVDSILPLIDVCAEYRVRHLFLKPVMKGMWRVPMPALDRLDAATRQAVDVLVRTVDAENTEIEMPQAVASLAVTLAADNHIYPCCHLTSDEWRIGSVGEIDSLQNSERFQVTAAAYAKTPHACRVHDAWRGWQVTSKSVWQTK